MSSSLHLKETQSGNHKQCTKNMSFYEKNNVDLQNILKKKKRGPQLYIYRRECIFLRITLKSPKHVSLILKTPFFSSNNVEPVQARGMQAGPLQGEAALGGQLAERWAAVRWGRGLHTAWRRTSPPSSGAATHPWGRGSPETIASPETPQQQSRPQLAVVAVPQSPASCCVHTCTVLRACHPWCLTPHSHYRKHLCVYSLTQFFTVILPLKLCTYGTQIPWKQIPHVWNLFTEHPFHILPWLKPGCSLDPHCSVVSRGGHTFCCGQSARVRCWAPDCSLPVWIPNQQRCLNQSSHIYDASTILYSLHG